MRKLTGLLLAALMMFFGAFAFAEEAAEPPADLFDLWDYGGESPAWVASAAPIAEGILLAPLSVINIPPEQLAVSDGAHVWETAAILPDEDNSFVLVFYDTENQAPRYGSWSFLSWGESVTASSCTVRFGDRLGSRINRGVLASEELIRNGQHWLLLTLTDPAPTGSPVLTPDGRLAGIITAQWADDDSRVLVMPADGIARGVASVAGKLTSMPAWGDAPEGLTLTTDKNTVTIDWSGMTLPEKPEGSDVWMVLVDTGNSYLSSFPADTEERSLTMVLTPGRFYIVGPVVTAGRPSTLPDSYASIFIPNAEKLADYGFKPVQTCIAEAPEGGLKDGEAPVPVTEVTEQLLRSGRAYFYSHSTYEVTEDIECSLLVTLTDPEGNNYRYQSGWLYSPEYMAEDIWYISLTENLTESLDKNGYPAGIYHMAFYVDGKLADEFAFEIK